MRLRKAHAEKTRPNQGRGDRNRSLRGYRQAGAQDAEQKASETDSGNSGSAAAKTVPARRYADKETPLAVVGDMDDIQMQLIPTPPNKSQKP
jgi:hypothetical protein